MTRRLVYVFILIASSALAVGLWTQDLKSLAGVVLFIGIMWMIAQMRNIAWISSVMLFLFALASVAATYAGVAAWLTFTCLAASLIAWDLSHFANSLLIIGVSSDSRTMERAHLLRLGLVIGIAAVGFLVAGRIRVDLTFASAGILALIVVWGVSTLIYSLRRRE